MQQPRALSSLEPFARSSPPLAFRLSRPATLLPFHGIHEKVSPAGTPWHLHPPPPARMSVLPCVVLLVTQLSGSVCSKRALEGKQ